MGIPYENKYAKNFQNGSVYYNWKQLTTSSLPMGCGWYSSSNFVFCIKFTVTEYSYRPLRIRLCMNPGGGWGSETVSWHYKFFTSESDMNNYKNASTGTSGDGTVSWNKGDGQVTTLSFNREFTVGTHYVAFWRTAQKGCEIRWARGDGSSNYYSDIGGDRGYRLSFTGDSGFASASPQGVYATGTDVSVTVKSKPGYLMTNYVGNAYDGTANTKWTDNANKDSHTSTWSVGTHDRAIYVNTHGISYTIEYDGNGNTGGSTASSSHTYGTAKALTANGFIKTGYTFQGWATSASGAKVYNDGQSVSNLTTTNNGTVTLYAVWAKNNTYQLTINPNGGSYNGSTNTQYMTGLSYTTSYEINTPPIRTGYTFSGWQESGSGNITSGYYDTKVGMINASKQKDADGAVFTRYTMSHKTTGTVYPYISFFHYNFTAGHTYRITYDSRVNTASGMGYCHIRHSGIDNNWEAPAINENYTHEWRNNSIERVINSTTTNGGTTSVSNPLVELYCQIPPGSTGNLSIDIKNLYIYDVTSGNYVTSKNSVKNGCTFYVWGNTTITAVWTLNTYANLIECYTFGYKHGEGNNEGNTAFKLGTKFLNKSYGSSVTPAKSDGMPIPNGFNIKLWASTEISGTWTDYSFGDSFTQPDKPISIEYDYWPINYTITYNLNGGTNNSNNPSTYNVLYGITFSNPTRVGYEFIGWQIDNKVVTGINPGANATFSSADDLYTKCAARTTGDIIVTAIWRSKGCVYISDGTSFSPYLVYIYDGSSWGWYAPYIYTSSGWELCAGD